MPQPKLKVTPFEAKTLSWWRSRRDRIDIGPLYQRRGRLWSATDKAYLIDSILSPCRLPYEGVKRDLLGLLRLAVELEHENLRCCIEVLTTLNWKRGAGRKKLELGEFADYARCWARHRVANLRAGQRLASIEADEEFVD